MGRLQPLTDANAWGGCDIVESDPELETFEDVYFAPLDVDGAGGLFDRSDRMLMGSVDLFLPEGLWFGRRPDSPVTWRNVSDAAPDASYVYGGRFNPHYGHFLVDVIARYWPWAREIGGRPRILVHDPDPWGFLRRTGFAGEWLGALGLGPDDFVSFDRPVRIRRLVLPWTSFRHQTYAHRVYGDLGRRIGSALLGARPRTTRGRPVYLSKSELGAGIRRFSNERPLERALVAGGVEIVHPERMTTADKAALFGERPAVLGMAGSGFHDSIFAPEVSARLLLLSPRPSINSNVVLFDRLTGADSRYLHVVGARPIEGTGAFRHEFELEDPEDVARELLELI